MNTGRIVFSPFMMVCLNTRFVKLWLITKGISVPRSLSCWDQLLSLCFGQLTFLQSLRELTPTLNALGSRRYNMGIKTKDLAARFPKQMPNLPWQIFPELAHPLIGQAKQLYCEDWSSFDF